MSMTAGMYMFRGEQYGDEVRASQALEMLYDDRKNEFRLLAEQVLPAKALKSMPNWREFVLNFSLDVEAAFRTWSGSLPLTPSSPQKALTLLRQLGRDKMSMNELVHLLNMSFNISMEFREIYRRLQ